MSVLACRLVGHRWTAPTLDERGLRSRVCSSTLDATCTEVGP